MPGKSLFFTKGACFQNKQRTIIIVKNKKKLIKIMLQAIMNLEKNWETQLNPLKMSVEQGRDSHETLSRELENLKKRVDHFIQNLKKLFKLPQRILAVESKLDRVSKKLNISE